MIACMLSANTALVSTLGVRRNSEGMMAMQPAKRLNHLPRYPFTGLNQKIASLRGAGHDVIALHIGNPDLPPPPHVVEVLHQSATNPTHHGYAGYTGTPGLRQAIAEYYWQRFGVMLDSKTQVLPLLGSKEVERLTEAFMRLHHWHMTS
jgi:aspartate/methionine/tyrosine aminotransferase